MDELSVSDLLAGLSNAEYADYHVTLLQLLSNACAEPTISQEELRQVAVYSFHRLTTLMLNISGNEEAIDLLLIAISNLTILEEACGNFLKTIDTEGGDLLTTFTKFIDFFLDHNPQAEEPIQSHEEDAPNISDPFQHMSSVLCNITNIELGRNILLRQSSGYMPKLVAQVNFAVFGNSPPLISLFASVDKVQKRYSSTRCSWMFKEV